MISPLCEKTRSTGAELAGTQKTLENSGLRFAYAELVKTSTESLKSSELMNARYWDKLFSHLFVSFSLEVVGGFL